MQPKIKIKDKKKPLADGQPFDFKFIKIVVKKTSSEKDKDLKEIFLERDWV
jgi:hypothetical protein